MFKIAIFQCGFEESLLPSNNEVFDNEPTTSKGTRTKTVSTSSAGSCSYSAIAIHCQKEHTPWSNLNAAQKTRTLAVAQDQTSDDGETSILNSIHTNLGDVLAQALSQKKQKKSAKSETETSNTHTNAGNNGNKKSKKSKKMLPLYSTGMNFSGN